MLKRERFFPTRRIDKCSLHGSAAAAIHAFGQNPISDLLLWERKSRGPVSEQTCSGAYVPGIAPDIIHE